MAALEYLKRKNPFYAGININDDNVKAYEDANGEVDTVTVLHKDWEPELEDIEMPFSEKDHLMENTLKGDFPLPDTILPNPLAKDDVETLTKKAIDTVGQPCDKTTTEGQQDEKMTTFAMPERGTKPLSEFEPGYYSKTFPHLFPNGDGEYRRVSPY